MTIVSFIPNTDIAELVIAWTESLADTNEKIEYICFDNQLGQNAQPVIQELLTQSHHPDANLFSITFHLPIIEILERCQQLKPRRLIVGNFELKKNQSTQPQNAHELLRSSACETYLILSGSKKPEEVQKTLLMTTGGVHDLASLRLAERLRSGLNTEVCIGTVEEESGAQKLRTGKRFLKSLLHDSALDHRLFQAKVVVDQDRRRGVLRCFDKHDLVIAGRDEHLLMQSMGRPFGESTVLLVKRTPALSLRSLPDWLPRIHPGDHADLLHNMRQGSRWNNDFIWMLGLASAIASLGLLQNSPAVVIGSMLLAPLMTPMIGVGLALAEADTRMVWHCFKTIGKGFLLTLAVSMLIGLVTPSRETLAPEIISRGDPNVLDLLIAVFAAVAATIAMARPNIVGAIAGVAIATALVPPVCAIGLSLAMGYFWNGLGATVLFLTNLIAIMVSSSVTFTFLGVTASRALASRRQISQFIRLGLFITLIVLAGPLSSRLFSQLNEGRPQSAVYPVTRAVFRALNEKLSETPRIKLTFMGRSSVTGVIVIHIASDQTIPESYGNELRKIVRDVMKAPKLKVIVVALDGQWLSEDDSTP